MKPIYLYVTPFFPSVESWRGGFCYDAVRALQRSGQYNVIVMVPGRGPDYVYEGVQVRRFKRLDFPSGLFPFLLAGINVRMFFQKLKQLEINFEQVAVCHAHTMECGIYAYAIKKRRDGILTFLQTHQMGAPYNLQSGRFGVVPLHADFLYHFYRKLFLGVDCNIMLSELHVRQFGQAYPRGPLYEGIDIRRQLMFGRLHRRIPLKNPYVFYNGIDTRVFNSKGRTPHVGFTIGCVANFGETKDQLTLLRAIDDLKQSGFISEQQEFRVELVGTGPMLDACKKFVHEHDLESIVEFQTEVGHLQLPQIYQSFDLFVLPTWQEGFCCTLVEAAGCGCPIMSCRTISVAEVVANSDWDKWLFAPQDYKELAQKIRAYLEHRWVFRFNRSLDIDDLWADFLGKIQEMRVKDGA